MQEMKTDSLTTVFSEVLASLAFMFTDDEEAATSTEDQWLETTICYDGPAAGMLRFRCTREFSISLSANLLGMDPEEPDAESNADDAAKEFMNIICGQFITTEYGTGDVFNITIPEIKELPEEPQWSDDCHPNASTLSVDGQRVQLTHLPRTDEEAP